jgi:methyltransferase (TIGR00027 family)
MTQAQPGRFDGDSWDPASSVGATATMVAASRALASQGPDALLDDPFADPLVRAVGLPPFIRLIDGEVSLDEDDPALNGRTRAEQMTVRTRFFDDFFINATQGGIRQAVILASGLDTRAYRLPWPAGTVVYEIDQPQVIDFKTNTLANLGANPTAERRTVSIDLRDDWPTALQAVGFDTAQPTAWLAEGVLIGFLPQEAEVRLLDSVTALSAPGSTFAADFGSVRGETEKAKQQAQTMTDRWREHGVDLHIPDLTYPGEHTDVGAYLQQHGWDTRRSGLADLFASAGLAPLGTDVEGSAPASIGFVRATRR